MDSLADQLRAAREMRSWSRSRLSHATGKVDDRPYVSEPTVEAIEIGKTKRPDDETILRLGEALEVPDQLFPAYALARARRALDEWQVGDAALANLTQLAQAAPTVVRERMEQELDGLVLQARKRGSAGAAAKRDPRQAGQKS